MAPSPPRSSATTVPMDLAPQREDFVDLTVPVGVSSHQPNPEESHLPQPAAAPTLAISTLDRVLVVSPVAAAALRFRRGEGTPRERVVFHQHSEVPVGQYAKIDIRFLFHAAFNGMEANRDYLPCGGDVIAKDYCVEGILGTGSFATVYRTKSLRYQKPVAVKILRNEKECFDTGLGEVRMYSLLHQHDPEGRRHIVRMLDCFYTREHLFIVTELLNSSLFAHYMHLESVGKRTEYYNASTLRALSAQMLDALDFCASHGIAHCDVKTANICIANTEARQFKLIDFGSAVLQHDVHVSYLQSRWYRAPEVILGCEWGPKIDVWSLGCVLAELLLGYCPFQFTSSALVLAAQKATMGPFPGWMLDAHPIAQMFFTASSCVYEVDPPRMPPGTYLLRSTPDASLSSLLRARVNAAIFGEALPGVTSFLESLLTIDPNERPSATGAVQHAWLAASELPPAPELPAAPARPTDEAA